MMKPDHVNVVTWDMSTMPEEEVSEGINEYLEMGYSVMMMAQPERYLTVIFGFEASSE